MQIGPDTKGESLLTVRELGRGGQRSEIGLPLKKRESGFLNLIRRSQKVGKERGVLAEKDPNINAASTERDGK